MARIAYLTTIDFGPGEIAGLPAALAELGIAPAAPRLRPRHRRERAPRAGDRAAAAGDAGLPRHPAQPHRGGGGRRARRSGATGGCDGIVALGGGSPIDLAKGVALLATHPGPLEQYAAIYGGLARITAAVAPVVAVPTTAGTGAEVGRAALLTLADGRKLGVLSPHLIPKRAICDPELTLGLPPGLTAATGLDALSHCIETFLSPRDNPPAEAIALDGAGRVWRNLETACRDGGEPRRAQRGDDGGAGRRPLVPEGPRRGAFAQPRARRAAGPEAAPRHAERDPDAAGGALQRPRGRRRSSRGWRRPWGCRRARTSRTSSPASTGGSGCPRGSRRSG